MKPGILLVDDELNILRALERMLRRAGYDVHCASNAKDALVVLEQQDIQVIITDFRMPEINGAEFLQLARAKNHQAVAMILSAYADFNSVVEVLNSGLAFKFLQKPWLESQLLADIDAAFAKYEDAQQQHLRTQLLIGSQDALLEFDRSGRLVRFNAAGQKLLGLSAVDMQQAALSTLFPNIPIEQLAAFLQKQSLSLTVTSNQGATLELIHQLSDDDHYLLRLESVQSVLHITEQFADMPEVLDQLHLLQEIDLSLAADGRPFAVIYLDIRNFSDVHHSLGFQGADQLVAMLGTHLLHQTKDRGKLAYLFADQFVIVIQKWRHEAQLQDIVHDALRDFDKPQVIHGKAVHVRFNVGYTIAPDDGSDAKTLVHQARLAARSHNHHNTHFMLRYDKRYIESRKLQYEISNALYAAVHNDELQLAYQCKVNLTNHKIESAEVLLRWNHPELGAVSPAIFIPIAERDGQIHELGIWVVRNTLAQLCKWREEGLELPQLAINISPVQLQQPDFIENLLALLREFKVKPSQLQLELTETAVMEHIEYGLSQLQLLREAGFSIAIDDFGTGYSSLSYLIKLPVDVVKLDRSIINDIEHSLATQSMVRNVIRMSHELGISLVAEGIETKEQHDLLTLMNCNYAQGYLYSKPVDAGRFLQLAIQQPLAAILSGEQTDA